MTQDIVMEVFNAAVALAFKLSAPVLIVATVIGLVVAVLQAATQVHEQTLSFAPKAVGVALALLAFGPWMMNETIDFMKYIFELMSTVA